MITCDVLVPFYGNEKYLIDCIESLNQQVLNEIHLEVTIINDNPEKVLQELVSKNPGITINVINNAKNLGLARNWNKCLMLNKNEYFHLLHYDDLLERNFYEVMINQLGIKNRVGIIICKAKNKFENKISSRYWSSKIRAKRKDFSVKKYVKGDDAIHGVMGMDFVCSGVILTKEAISNSGTFNEELKFSTDEEYWARVVKNNDLLITNNELVNYRFHGQNYALSTWTKTEFADLFVKTRLARLNLLSKITEEDNKNEFEKIALMFVNIAYKLNLKQEGGWSAFYINKAKEIYPDIIHLEYFKKVDKAINGHPMMNLLRKLKSAH